MIHKISKGVWLISLLGLLAALLWVYAGLPEQVMIQQTDTGITSLSRDSVFYIVLGLSAIFNALVFVISAVFNSALLFRTWFNGLIITLNAFTMVALFTLSALNGTERFDVSRIAFLLYGSLSLVILWCIAWPLFILFQKFLFKESN